MGQLLQWRLIEPVGLDDIGSSQVDAAVERVTIAALRPRARVADQRQIAAEETGICLRWGLWVEEGKCPAEAIAFG